MYTLCSLAWSGEGVLSVFIGVVRRGVFPVFIGVVRRGVYLVLIGVVKRESILIREILLNKF